jgi:small subunit ribosomal protein S20
MANIRSAEKQMRQAEKAKTRNRAGKSTLKSQLKKARTAIEGKAEDMKDVLSQTFSTIDKSARKKLIKPNTADRYKSRLSDAAKKSKAAAK